MTRLGEITPCYTMRFERASKHPAKRLWRAITDPAEVTQWMISPLDDRCRFTFVHHGQPPGMVDEEAGIAAGWHEWLDDLDTYLHGGSPEHTPARAEEFKQSYTMRIARVLNP